MKSSAEVHRETSSVPGRSVLAFGVVGAGAFLLHLVVVSILVPAGTQPLVANVAGFSLAFSLSFFGHGRWSFPPSGRTRPRALPRFLLVALAGFLVNECLYWILLGWTSLDYRLALSLVLTLVAIATFVSSKYWVFASEPS